VYTFSQPSLQPVPHNFTCPADSKLDLISTINYPSIGVSGFKGNENKRVHRTVINVNIQATPEKLQDYYEIFIEHLPGNIRKH
ncbi:unnamed protein product, partial [Brassica rapa]